MQMLHPIPDALIAPATALWRDHFGMLGWPRGIDSGHGIVAVGAAGDLRGIIGLRDHRGGLVQGQPPLAGWLFRPAPPTADLVIDGLAVTRPRQGTGRALVAHALSLAATSHPGLRAEVRAANTSALAFYRALGFVTGGHGRFGPPWGGPVVLLRCPSRIGAR